jgi:hypothetical protein
MAAQAIPTYAIATGKPEEPIVKELIRKYGYAQISWPIILSEGDKTIAYLYEINSKNKTNSYSDIKPNSQSGIPSHLIDYTVVPRVISPHSSYLSDFISDRYSCSYDYITSSPYSTVDLDYVWLDERNFKGFELTTFWMDFYNKQRAGQLVSKMNRRPSWQGPNGAHALHKIVDATIDLGIDYYMVCVNTVSKVGSEIKTNGNVYFFRLTHDQINRLFNGQEPLDAQFCSFENFLNWL